jgi:hypothetical protein
MVYWSQIGYSILFSPVSFLIQILVGLWVGGLKGMPILMVPSVPVILTD